MSNFIYTPENILQSARLKTITLEYDVTLKISVSEFVLVNGSFLTLWKSMSQEMTNIYRFGLFHI